MSNLDIDLLVADLNALASSTWHKIMVGPDRGLKFREESITDHNLFELDQRHPALSAYKFTTTEESLNGADFDWWIGSDDHGWTGIRFQAKKLDDGSYTALGHRVDGERQYDRLLREADRDRVWPVYCFYNGWAGDWPDGVDNRVCPKNLVPPAAGSSRRRGHCIHARLEQFGCSVAPASSVANRHRGARRGRLELDDYLAMSVPWSFLFETRKRSHESSSDPLAPLDILNASLGQLFGGELSNVAYRHAYLPPWVQAVRSGERADERYAPSRSLLLFDLEQR